MTLRDVVEVAGTAEVLALVLILLALGARRKGPARARLEPRVQPGRAEAREAARSGRDRALDPRPLGP